MIQKTASQYFKEKFGCKVYKLSLDGGMTCPNRDGSIGRGGCIFCLGGSGEFAQAQSESISRQIEEAKARVSAKLKKGKYIAYFQSYTNTYAPIEYLERIFTQAMEPDDIVALSVATRPDCLGDEVISLLARLNRIKPVFVELGLQTADDRVAEFIRRGYETALYDEAVKRLTAAGLEVIAHMIIGLPGEDLSSAADTARHIAESGAKGIKFHLLHVLRGTDMEKEYLEGRYTPLTLLEYTEILKVCIARLPPDMVIHRLTGDGAKKDLVAPLWSADKKRVLNHIKKELEIC